MSPIVATVAVSAETGNGLDALVDATVRAVSHDVTDYSVDMPLLTQERHRFAVGRALDEARAFRDRWKAGDVPAPVAAVHLREAVTVLEDLIGAVDVEDVLDEVFRRFCVGK
jgi:tRNA modification GTPase